GRGARRRARLRDPEPGRGGDDGARRPGAVAGGGGCRRATDRISSGPGGGRADHPRGRVQGGAPPRLLARAPQPRRPGTGPRLVPGTETVKQSVRYTEGTSP